MTDHASSSTLAVITGDWLYDDERDTYTDAYVGEITSRWGGGGLVGWRASRAVAEQVVRWQQRTATDGADVLRWDGDVLVLDGADEHLRVEADADGLYAMPGWAWFDIPEGVNVDTVHSDEPRREVLVHLNVETAAGDPRTADEIADEILAALAVVASDGEHLAGLTIVCPLAEDA